MDITSSLSQKWNLCEYPNISNKLIKINICLKFRSKRLFETSILQHWYKLKYVFLFEQAAIIFENNPFFGSRPVSDYYQNSTVWSQLYFTQTNSLFVFILYSSIITIIGFICEVLWYQYFHTFKWNRF